MHGPSKGFINDHPVVKDKDEIQIICDEWNNKIFIHILNIIKIFFVT